MRAISRSVPVIPLAAGVCFLVSSATGGDPLFWLEVAIGSVVLAWAVVAALLIVRTARLAGEITSASEAMRVAGIDCLVVVDSRPLAFVAGVRRPSVVVTTGAMEQLAPRELRAVLLHEAHHARSKAPVRAAFVDAWMRVVPRFAGIGSLLTARLDALEIAADCAARARGARVSDLAAALVKLDPSAGATGFANGGEDRLRALLSDERASVATVPIEWLPLLLTVGLVAGCNLAGTAIGL